VSVQDYVCAAVISRWTERAPRNCCGVLQSLSAVRRNPCIKYCSDLINSYLLPGQQPYILVACVFACTLAFSWSLMCSQADRHCLHNPVTMKVSVIYKSQLLLLWVDRLRIHESWKSLMGQTPRRRRSWWPLFTVHL